MKLIPYFLLIFVFLSGCASQQTRQLSFAEILARSVEVAGTENLMISKIPTHGSLSDAIAIGVKGGGNASQLKETILKVDKSGGAVVVVSVNPKLSKAVIEGAMDKFDSAKKSATVIYAGSAELSASVKTTVESKGFKYGFVESTKPI